MKKRDESSKKEKELPKMKPQLKWQKGDYARDADFRFILPEQFLLLCKLMEVTPEEVLVDFMDNLSCSNWKRDGREAAKAKLVDYFICHRYGQHHYTEEDIRTIFKELDAIGAVWPVQGKMKLMELSARWREKFQSYWFKRWYRRTKRKLA